MRNWKYKVLFTLSEYRAEDSHDSCQKDLLTDTEVSTFILTIFHFLCRNSIHALIVKPGLIKPVTCKTKTEIEHPNWQRDPWEIRKLANYYYDP